MNKKNAIFKNRQLKVKTKIRELKCYVWSVLFYVCDAWTISESMKERIKSVEMWFLRNIFIISWKNRDNNEELLRRVEIERILMKVISKKTAAVLWTCNEI